MSTQERNREGIYRKDPGSGTLREKVSATGYTIPQDTTVYIPTTGTGIEISFDQGQSWHMCAPGCVFGVRLGGVQLRSIDADGVAVEMRDGAAPTPCIMRTVSVVTGTGVLDLPVPPSGAECTISWRDSTNALLHENILVGGALRLEKTGALIGSDGILMSRMYL